MHRFDQRLHDRFAPPRRITREAQPASTVSNTNAFAKVEALLEWVKTVDTNDLLCCLVTCKDVTIGYILSYKYAKHDL